MSERQRANRTAQPGRALTDASGRAGREGAQAVSAMATTFAIQGLGVVTGILTARMLGVEGRGELAIVLLLASIAAYVGDLGLPLAYVFQSASDRRSVPALLGNALPLTVVTSVVVAVGGGPLAWWFLAGRADGLAIVGVVVLVGYVPLNLATRYLNALNHGLAAYGPFNAVRLSVPLCQVAVLAALACLGLDSVAWVASATLVSNAAALGLVVPRTRRRLVGDLGPPRVDTEVLRSSLRYGVRAHVGNLAPVDALQLDLLVVAAALGTRAGGLYAVAISASSVVRAQGTALGMVALPAVAGRGDQASRAAAVSTAFRVTLVATSATAVVLGLVAGPLVELLYGAAFAGSAGVVRVLAVGAVAAACRQVLGDGLRGMGRPLDATLAEVTALGAASALLWWVLPDGGTTGAAGAISAAWVLAVAVGVGGAHRAGIAPSSLVPRADDVARVLRLARSLR